VQHLQRVHVPERQFVQVQPARGRQGQGWVHAGTVRVRVQRSLRVLQNLALVLPRQLAVFGEHERARAGAAAGRRAGAPHRSLQNGQREGRGFAVAGGRVYDERRGAFGAQDAGHRDFVEPKRERVAGLHLGHEAVHDFRLEAHLVPLFARKQSKTTIRFASPCSYDFPFLALACECCSTSALKP
jgi:hypothetical protein